MKQLAKVFNRNPVYRKKSTVDWPLPEQLVGLEVEAENIRNIQVWPDEAGFGMYWRRTSDGSLQRGNEYVLAQPQSGDALGGAIQSFFSTGKLMRDPAGSTHIHLNMMGEDDTVDGLRNLCVLMYLFEELLFVVGDPGRAACGYTNRLITAPEQVLRTIFNPLLDEKPQMLAHVFSDMSGGSRYYGFNMKALGKHGTVEFRYFPTATSAEELINWIKLLMSFKKAAINLGTVAGIERMLASEDTYLEFVNENFGAWYEQFLATIPYSQASSTLNTICAMHSGILQQQDVNVNLDKLKNSIRFGKFFTRRAAKEAAPEKAVYPDKIHCLSRGELLPENVEGFDGSLKHLMIYDSSIYIWKTNGGWQDVDGYSMYSRACTGDTGFVDEYITWNSHLITLMQAAFEARQAAEPLSTVRYNNIRSVLIEFRDWIINIETMRANGLLPSRNKRDGVYRLKSIPLNCMWATPEDSSLYDNPPVEQGDYDEDEEDVEAYSEEDDMEEEEYDDTNTILRFGIDSESPTNFITGGSF